MSSSESAGTIIYKAFSPTLKMALCIMIGFAITKKGIFPPANAKGVSILTMNVGLPCLIFSSMVTAFTPENIVAFGPLAMMAVMYQMIGLSLAWVIKEFFWIPADFRWGILVAGLISNWGNLPTAVVQVMAQSPPFNPTTDVDLGVAYIAIFILIMNSTFFALGVHKICAWDFREDHMMEAPLPLKERWQHRLSIANSLVDRASSTVFRRRRRSDFFSSNLEKRDQESDASHASGLSTAVISRSGMEEAVSISPSSPLSEDDDEGKDEPTTLRGGISNTNTTAGGVRYAGGEIPSRKKSRAQSFTSMMESTRSIPPTIPLDAPDIANSCDGPTLVLQPVNSSTSTHPALAADRLAASAVPGQPLLPVCSNHGGKAYSFHEPATPPTSRPKRSWPRFFLHILANIPPPTWGTILGVPISVVSPLKALFTTVDGWTGTRMPNAPDGYPPLYFILETTSFLGAITVPTALVLLGASFARLKLPKSIKELPIAAICGLTVSKMIISPIFGIFVVKTLRDNTSLFPASNKIEIFVTILLSGTPSAANQLVVTQLYNPAGSADSLASFLLLQYMCMFVLSTALAAIALYIVM